MKNQNLSHKINTVAVWIETPGQAFTVGEGIARVILFLIASWQKQGIKVNIYCSDVCLASVKRVGQDLGLNINDNSIGFVTAKETTVFTRKLNAIVQRVNAKIAENKYVVKERLHIIYYAIKAVLQKLKGNHYAVVPNLNFAVRSGLVVVWMLFKLTFLFIFKLIFEKLNNVKLFRANYKKVLLSKAKKFRPDVWYIPRPDWDAAVALGPRLIWAFWDFIPVEALVHFPIDAAIASVKRAAGAKGEIVTMSNYVKVNHCVKIFGVESEKVRSKQPPFHLAVKQIERQQAVEALPRLMADWVNQPAARTVNARYIVDFPFDKVDFIFMPTQIRGYKNFYNVILAVEEIIRRKRIDIKLVTTGDLKSEFAQDALKYMHARGLVFDIISIPGLSTDALNCFFKLAKLVICPAFAEGGIPLSFMEGVMQGTPVIISRMPNSLEFFDMEDPVAQKYSFDPSSVDAIVSSIVYALNNCDTVKDHQSELIRKQFGYTWDDYAKFVLDAKT